MNRKHFAQLLQEDLTAIRVSSQLRSRTLGALAKQPRPIMKRRLSFALALALTLLACCAAAIAVAYHAGILDFAGRSAQSHVPDDAQDYVQSDVLLLENELVSVSMHELYYDGRISRMTVDVQPKDSSTMLLGVGTMPEDPWQNTAGLEPSWDITDARTVADVYRAGGYQSAYDVDVWLAPLVGQDVGGSGSHHLAPDGTLTLYCQVEYEDDQPRRDVLFTLYLTPYEVPLAADSPLLSEKMTTLTAQLTLEAAAMETETYVSTAPADVSDAGVRVDRLTIEVKPQELHAVIEYTVTNPAAYQAAGDGLWFEFIHPESSAEQPHEQRLQSGLSAGGRTDRISSPSESPARYRQTETLGRNELHDVYTLRAFSLTTGERFEKHRFQMVKKPEME